MNLFDFTYCGNYNRQIQNLARISPEKWSFGQSGDNGILKGYLENTFRRLYEEGKVREEKEYALFHTGLFNQYYQPIYAYFVPNVVPDRQKWYLEGFYTSFLYVHWFYIFQFYLHIYTPSSRISYIFFISRCFRSSAARISYWVSLNA